VTPPLPLEEYTSVNLHTPPASPTRGQVESPKVFFPSGRDVSGSTTNRRACIIVGVALTVVTAVIVGLFAGIVSTSGSSDDPWRNVAERAEALERKVPFLVFETSTSTTTTATTTATSTTSTTSMTHTTTETKTTLTTTTKTVTTTTETNTSTTTSTTTLLPYPTLFCFSVMRAHGYELALVRSQLAQGVSIFGCEAWAVYSDKNTWLTPGPPVRLESVKLNTSLQAKTGRVEHILNTEVFVRAFEAVRADPKFKASDWVVKVDPDAVFFPQRLKQHILRVAPARGGALYFINCKASFGLFGALEVFSKRAMETYSDGVHHCKAKLDWKEWGEDLWMRRCMDLLNVQHVNDFKLLSDAYCGAQPSPCTAHSVAFHPFKAPETYFTCWRQGEASLPSESLSSQVGEEEAGVLVLSDKKKEEEAGVLVLSDKKKEDTSASPATFPTEEDEATIKEPQKKKASSAITIDIAEKEDTKSLTEQEEFDKEQGTESEKDTKASKLEGL